MLRANAHYLDVTMEVPDPGEELRLALPVWTPGHYHVDDHAGNLDRVRAFDQDTGRELPAPKLEKSLWAVSSKGSRGVRVEYSVYGFVYSVSGTYVDDKHAIINGPGVYLYVVGRKDAPARLKLVPWPGWKAVSTGLEHVSGLEYSAPDYDVLADSPVEAGNQRTESFESGGARYEVSMSGTPLTDEGAFVSDLKKLVEGTASVYGQAPYSRYVFIVNFTDTAQGGLEHLNSTVCFLPRFRTLPREEYNRSISLFSHELFHAWNVKRMRPVGLGPFDYTKEVYTKSLWVAEGLTSYYANLALRRAGLNSVEEYLESLAQSISIMKSLPGRTHQSAEEASFDTWTKFDKPNENTPNVTSSYYVQGCVVGWMLDMVFRDAGKGTLDDVMRKVYADTYLKGRGYTDAEFEGACVALGGERAKEVFDARVRGREDIDFDRYLALAGLRLEPKDAAAAKKGFLGVKLGSEGGRTLVRGVLAGSPAEGMGLSFGDEVIGLDGLRVSQERLSFFVGAAGPGRGVALTLARNGMLTEAKGELAPRPSFEWRVQPLAGASAKQRALFKGWLLADWTEALTYAEFPRSPDRRVVFDYV
jgi:predicted metalloprotease with PDZ domain